MRITIYPQADLPGNPDDIVAVEGDTVTVNTLVYDLSAVPEGGEAWPGDDPEAPAPHPFIGPIRRIGGDLQFGMLYRYDASTAAPEQPADMPVIDVTSGALPDPILRREVAP